MGSQNQTFSEFCFDAVGKSSFGLHSEYHQPSDHIAHIDFAHMTRSINSLLKPVQWLVNTDFAPAWAKGKKP